MFKKIMVPVDLAHADKLEKAVACAEDIAGHYGAAMVIVGVTSSAPSSVAHSPAEFGEKLAAYAAGRGKGADTHVSIAHDPTTEVDDALLKAVAETGADLVVMASHAPGILDHLWPSNGGKLAGHASCSVMLVRS